MSNTVDFYDAAMVLWRTVTNIFFREIRPRGTFNIPREGPVIFVAGPHHNQFLDLLMALPVYRETGRKVRFIVAAKSMKHRYIGFFGRMLSSIPVRRAQDEAKPGTGYLSLSDDDSCLIIGHGTKFLSELAPKMQIMLPKSLGSSMAEVAEVLTDTSLRIRKEFGGDNSKHTSKLRDKMKEIQATGKPGAEFKRIPCINHQEMYQHVYDCMKSGGCLGIFPEGGSHDRPELLPLKAGVALMALGAMASHPGLKVKIVPVGLSYFHAHKFRSRAVVEFGTPMEIPGALVDMYREGGSQKRSAVTQLLSEISNALKTVTVTAPDYDTLMLIQAARRLYKSPGQQLTLGQVVELNKRFLFAYSHFKDEPKVIKLRNDVMKYNRLIRDLGLKDHQVPRARKNTLHILGLLCYRLLLLSVWSCLALPGVILNAPIFLLASSVARGKAKDALAASSVKIAARDVVATWKILISMGLTPILYTLYASLATMLTIRAGVPLSWRIWTPFLVLTILPMVAYAALKFGEAGMDVLKSLRPLVVALVPGQQKSLDRVKAMRERLSLELADAVNEYGPKLWDDFHKWRMVPPASAPPSARPVLGRSRSSFREEAQGLLLSHPMTWLDEKLFGWNSGSNSQDTSRVGTPDGSEDEPDYDQFLLSLEGKTPAVSRVGSYADLQRSRQTMGTGRSLKTSPIMTYRDFDSSSTEVSPIDEGLHMRTGHRNRGHSLSDRVPVTRIAQLGRRESFEEGTAELNREILIRKSHRGHQE